MGANAMNTNGEWEDTPLRYTSSLSVTLERKTKTKTVQF